MPETYCINKDKNCYCWRERDKDPIKCNFPDNVLFCWWARHWYVNKTMVEKGLEELRDLQRDK